MPSPRHLRSYLAILVLCLVPWSFAQPPVNGALVLDVLTYNTALLPEVAANTRQAERAARMAPHLVGYDVLVLQELFVNRWRETLLAELADAYPYQGDAGGERRRADDAVAPGRRRHDPEPLAHRARRDPPVRRHLQRHRLLGRQGDCLRRGACRRPLGHVFGTHAQSAYGGGARGVRAQQFAQFQAFVAAQGIPTDEPVILAGDFNANAFTDEVDDMLATLRASRPDVVGDMQATWDPAANSFAGGRRAQWLDYVLVSVDHAVPVEAWNRVMPLRDGEMDLSDHYALWGRFVWP